MITLIGFSIQYFSICLFNYQRPTFACEFQHSSKWKSSISLGFRGLMRIKCMDIFLIHLEIRIWRVSSQIYFWNWFFWLTKHFNPILQQGNFFFPPLNIIILQTVRILNLRFGGHVHVKYDTRSYNYFPPK